MSSGSKPPCRKLQPDNYQSSCHHHQHHHHHHHHHHHGLYSQHGLHGHGCKEPQANLIITQLHLHHFLLQHPYYHQQFIASAVQKMRKSKSECMLTAPTHCMMNKHQIVRFFRGIIFLGAKCIKTTLCARPRPAVCTGGRKLAKLLQQRHILSSSTVLVEEEWW